MYMYSTAREQIFLRNYWIESNGVFCKMYYSRIFKIIPEYIVFGIILISKNTTDQKDIEIVSKTIKRIEEI